MERFLVIDPSLKYLSAAGSNSGGLPKVVCTGPGYGDHDPQHVILMEIDPLHQKTLPDFLLTEKLLGMKTSVDHRRRTKVGKFLFYEHDRQADDPILRILQRAPMVDEDGPAEA